MDIAVLNLIILATIAFVFAWTAWVVVGSSRRMFINSVAVGFIGGLLGPWIASGLGIPMGYAMEIQGAMFPILWSIVGAGVFVAIGILGRRHGLYA